MKEHVKVKDNATYVDIEALTAGVTGEIIFGARLELRFGSINDGGPGAWTINEEPQLHHGRHVVMSDTAGWRLERCDTPPDQQAQKTLLDWVCESDAALSNSRYRVPKSSVCAEARVLHHLIIDPIGQTLEAFDLRNRCLTKIETAAGTNEVHAAPFDAISFSQGSLWPDEPPLSD